VLLKKTFTALLFLLVLAIPLVFSAVVLIKQQIIQYNRHEKFKTKKLETISVSSENIYWIKPGKEILFQGKLFDVKSYSIRNNVISLTGFFDLKEDKLVKQIVQLAQQKNKSESPYSKLAIKFIFSPAFLLQHKNKVEREWKFIANQFFSFDEMIPEAPTYKPTHPPC
jgi:hypothetical protein